jgi:hypothetical protein
MSHATPGDVGGGHRVSITYGVVVRTSPLSPQARSLRHWRRSRCDTRGRFSYDLDNSSSPHQARRPTRSPAAICGHQARRWCAAERSGSRAWVRAARRRQATREPPGHRCGRSRAQVPASGQRRRASRPPLGPPPVLLVNESSGLRRLCNTPCHTADRRGTVGVLQWFDH